jgi:hypothetical protein
MAIEKAMSEKGNYLVSNVKSRNSGIFKNSMLMVPFSGPGAKRGDTEVDHQGTGAD